MALTIRVERGPPRVTATLAAAKGWNSFLPAQIICQRDAAALRYMRGVGLASATKLVAWMARGICNHSPKGQA